ncbi:NUDIX domain-containing protein [Alloyangia pacifica]|uniref:NUDIX domain-containing protein n=1 Tax=Alloyangia pacifica TaxID=311180 RepID=UPI001CD486DF|nr:NUDIX domain-containing protein [Alloyangia pacifica]MCA0996634.1 NUDIX domain-containing protein [Alloyangia pacifica]
MLQENDIRSAVRAVIRKGPLVLVQAKRAASGQAYLTLPGGRQEPGESLVECLRRECLEEIGVVPEVGALLHVADVVRVGHGKTRLLLETLFECSVPDDYAPQLGARPDKRQEGTIWTDPAAPDALFLPRYDLTLLQPDAPVYLGRLRCEAP